MSHSHILELPVRCRIVRVRRLPPLHWALLNALQHFPAGNRPTLHDFASRLGLMTADPQAPDSSPSPLPQHPEDPSLRTSAVPDNPTTVSTPSAPVPATGLDSPAGSTPIPHCSAGSTSNRNLLSPVWEELLRHHTVDNARFQEASLTLEGREALRLSYLPLGPAEDHERFLHFDHAGNPRPFNATVRSRPQATRDTPPAPSPRPLPPSPTTHPHSSPQTPPPAWSRTLTPELLSAHLRSPACSVPLSDTEEIQSLSPLWPDARFL